MEGLAAIDEELEALAEGTDVEALVAKAHAELPDHSESFEVLDAMLENLGEAVSVPTVEPVGIEVPKLELPEIQPVPEPALAEVEVPDTAVHPSVPPAEAAEIPETREHAAPQSAVEAAAEADAGVDAIADGLASESGLDADDLFGDLEADSQLTPTEDVVDVSDALAQVRAMTSEPPPAEAAVAEAVAEGAEPEPPQAAPPQAAAPRTEPPPPPAEAGARDSVEELDLDEIILDDDDEFELMIDEVEAGDTFVGDAAEVEGAIAAEHAASTPPPPAEAEPEGEGEGGEDDAREQSFFKKLFG